MNGRRKKTFGNITLLVVSCAAALALAELVLRLVPIPGITYHTFRYDDLTGYRFYPHTSMIHRNARNEYVRRRVNAWGYLDCDHVVTKEASTTRIGFFGDSFTEARQVPLDRTFHQIIERRLNEASGGRRFECIAIAMSGNGTLQSYLEYGRWADSLSLDAAVYVFCENDPGDNLPSVKRQNMIPYPRAAGDSFIVDFSFREIQKHKKRLPHRMWQYLKSHSLLFSTLETRLGFLRARGIQVKVSDAQMQMSGRTAAGDYPNQGDLPSTWPDTLAAQARAITEMIIARWHAEAGARGRDFAVISIPRQSEMAKPLNEQDSWAPWLHRICGGHGIALIDPTGELLARKDAGAEVFYDHLTIEGHEAVAETFLERFTIP